MKEKSFKFRESFGAAVHAMDDKQAGKFVKGLCDYVFDRKQFESNDVALTTTFTLVKCALDQEMSDRENGQRGGIKSAAMKKRESCGVTVIAEIQKKPDPLDEMLKMVLAMAVRKEESENAEDGKADAKI